MSRIATKTPAVSARDNMRAREPVNCHEKKLTVTTIMICNAKITETAPRNKPIIKSIIID